MEMQTLKKDKKNKRRTILIILAILILLLVFIGVTYSFYAAKTKFVNKSQTIIKTNEVSLVYTGVKEITTGNSMIPGDSFTKTFTVENTSDTKTTYNIYMEQITNEFNEDLVFVLSDDNGEAVAETPLPATNAGKSYLLKDIEIDGGQLQSYTLKIEFKYLDTPQNDYQGKSFKATVGIDANQIETTTTSGIKVDATDSSGNNLNATATNITGDEKENLLTSLEETGYITSKEDVDALIEVESDDFDDLAITTFDVSSIAESGDTVVILHFDEEKQEWEYIGTEIVDEDGNVTGDFTSYSPVAFVVVKEDGIYEIIVATNNNIVTAYTYNQTSGASNYCVTGEEETCEKTKCYESTDANSCASGTIVDYKVNNTDTLRFHVMYDNGTTLTMQSQKNTIYNVAWYGTSSSYTNANGPLTILSELENATVGWNNVNNLTYTMGTTTFKTNAYTGCYPANTCEKNVYKLSERVAKARMITVQEALDLGCKQSNAKCPIWMYNYLLRSTENGGTIDDKTSSIYGYWTMNAVDTTSTNAWYIRMNGYVTSIHNYATEYSARAVVEVNK